MAEPNPLSPQSVEDARKKIKRAKKYAKAKVKHQAKIAALSVLPKTTETMVNKLSNKDKEALAYMVKFYEVDRTREEHNLSFNCSCFHCFDGYWRMIYSKSNKSELLIEQIMDEYDAYHEELQRKKFITGCVILLPLAMAITIYVTWCLINFVDRFFSPIYAQLGINTTFGLGSITTTTFIFLVGVFMPSWFGTSVLNLGERFIKRMPFFRRIYYASQLFKAKRARARVQEDRA